MRYFVRKETIHMSKGGINTPSERGFKYLSNEVKYFDDFANTYSKLSKRDKDKINKMKNNCTLYRCWYYARVWMHTRNSLKTIPKTNQCIDHILPIARCYYKNIDPELVGSVDNLQYLSHKQNLHKGTKLTARGKELLIQFTSL